MTDISFARVHPYAVVPNYARSGDAGADLTYCGANVVTLNPGERCLFGTGIALSIPGGWVGLIHPRSGMAAKLGVTVLNTPGTVDSGYRGEIKVNLINHGADPAVISPGDRIAQIVFQKFESASFVEVADLDITERGTGGHGSTGVSDGRI
jgi:dUTP pyrophosphatase